jgi:hypothetical protein
MTGRKMKAGEVVPHPGMEKEIEIMTGQITNDLIMTDQATKDRIRKDQIMIMLTKKDQVMKGPQAKEYLTGIDNALYK